MLRVTSVFPIDQILSTRSVKSGSGKFKAAHLQYFTDFSREVNKLLNSVKFFKFTLNNHQMFNSKSTKSYTKNNVKLYSR